MIAIGEGGQERAGNSAERETTTTAKGDSLRTTASLSRRVVQLALIVACSFAATAILLVTAFRDRTPQLTESALLAAQAKWQESQPKHYRMRLSKLGNRTDEVFIDVQDGEPVEFQMNGSNKFPSRVWSYWTVPGMFDTLEQELASADDPQRGFGASDGAQASFRAEFDPTYGYPRYYLRSVEPDALYSGWRVNYFEPLSSDKSAENNQ